MDSEIWTVYAKCLSLGGRVSGSIQANSCNAAILHEREPTFTCLVLHIDQIDHSCSALVESSRSQYPPLASGYASAKLPYVLL
jgi:hypothetical protein